MNFAIKEVKYHRPNFEENVRALTPPLKWAGGKRWLVPHIRPVFERHQESRLVEPFCGGLAVALGLQPERALLNDINEHLINFYSWLSVGLVTNLNMSNDEETYYNHRDRFNRLTRQGKFATEDAAALFYYLNRTGYNGLCRFNRAGELNVPFGRHKTINYVRDFRPYAASFRSWRFTRKDFEDLQLKSSDFVYADPPYDVPFTKYSKEGFSWDDQVRLANWLAKHEGPVLLSNQATPRILRLYRSLKFRLKVVNAPRMINCTGDRSTAREVLALRNI